jgi:hypothetical protein
VRSLLRGGLRVFGVFYPPIVLFVLVAGSWCSLGWLR